MPGGTEAFRLYGTVGVDPKPAMQGLDQLSGHVQKSGGIIQNAMGTALGFMGGTAMTSIISNGVGFLKGAAIDYNASMEQASIGFTTLLGSAEKAQSFIGDLQAFAAKTPFDFPGLQSAANQMLAMGFSSDEIIPKLTAVGDAVAALGGTPEMVGRATFALGQMKAAGRVTAQDMMQLTSMGIPAWQLLADSIGKSVPETKALAEKGLIPAEQAIEAITSGIEKGNMGGMMAQQSKTFVGAMSNITDTVNQAAGKALQPFFEMVSTGAQALAEWMGSAEGAAFFQGISDAVGGLIGGLKVLVGWVADIVRGFGALLKAGSPVQDTLGGILDTLQPLIAAVQGVVTAVVDVVDAFASFGLGSDQVNTALANLGTSIMGYITTWIETVPALLVELAGQFVAWIEPMIPQVLTGLGNLLLALGTWVMEQVPVLAGQMVTWAGAFVDWIGPMIPVFLDKLLTFVESGVNWLVSTGIPSFVKGLAKMAQELVAWVGPQIPVLLGKLGGLIVQVVGWIVTQGIPRLLGAALKLGGALVKGVIDLLMGSGGQPGLVASFGTFVTGTLVPGILKFGANLLQSAITLGGRIVKGVVDGLASLPGKIWNAVTQAFRSLKIDIGPFHITANGITVDLPKFATGSWSVPNTGPAIVHQGEMIIPADVANRLRKFGGQVGGGSAAPMLAQAGGGGGGGTTIIVEIGTFYGSQANIDALSRSLAERARYGKVG
jgi:tape measure domain-containing protein